MTCEKGLQVVCCLLVVSTGCQVEKFRFVDSAAGEIARATPSRACGVTPATVITGDGIGALRVGRTVSAITQRCVVVADSPVTTRDSVPLRLIRVDLLRDTAEAVVRGDTIREIEVADSAFHTPDHFSVDTRVARLLTLADVEGRTSGGSLWVVSPSHCGVSFRLEGPAPTPPAAQSGKAALRRLAGEDRVDRISMVGCGTTP